MKKGAEGREWIRLVRTSTEKEMEFEPGAIQLQAEDGTMVMLDETDKGKACGRTTAKLLPDKRVELCLPVCHCRGKQPTN